jgi:hypothetical protein
MSDDPILYQIQTPTVPAQSASIEGDGRRHDKIVGERITEHCGRVWITLDQVGRRAH